MTLLKKIDAQGNYRRFPGVTVIANVGNNNKHFWLAIYNFLNRSTILRQYYTPLPPSSYHMTTCNLYIQAERMDNWPAYITQNKTFFQQLHAKLAAEQFSPEISIEHPKVFNALQLNVSLPAEQYQIINKFAAAFDLNDKIPQKLHITLAYQYQNFTHDEVQSTLVAETEKLMDFCKENKEKLLLDTPELCFFHSMGKFTSWDGTTNPFIEKHTPG